MHFIAPARHELGTGTRINRRSNFTRFSHSAAAGRRFKGHRQWMDELGLAEFEAEGGGKVAAWVIARQSGSRAIGRQPRQPWLARLAASRLPRTCCLEPRWQDRRPPRRADGRPSLVSEDTLVDRRTSATTQPDKLFTTATNLLYYCLQEVILKFTLCFSWRKIPTKFLEV